MATTLTFKSPIGGIMAVTPSKVFADTAKNISAGANQASQLPQVGPCLIYGIVNFTAVGSACVTLAPCFAENSALSTNPKYCASQNTVGLPLANTVWTFQALNYAAASAYFGLWQAGTLTGTYTIDFVFEWYPLI